VFGVVCLITPKAHLKKGKVLKFLIAREKGPNQKLLLILLPDIYNLVR
jgi:hypothetical protein